MQARVAAQPLHGLGQAAGDGRLRYGCGPGDGILGLAQQVVAHQQFALGRTQHRQHRLDQGEGIARHRLRAHRGGAGLDHPLQRHLPAPTLAAQPHQATTGSAGAQPGPRLAADGAGLQQQSAKRLLGDVRGLGAIPQHPPANAFGKRMQPVGELFCGTFVAFLAPAAEEFAVRDGTVIHTPLTHRGRETGNGGEILRWRHTAGVEPDLAALERAASAGDARAAFRLGLALATGDGCPADPAAAARWCEQAARAGLPEAQFNLGLLLAAGRGVAADPDAAARWWRLAALNGVAEAEGCLDVLYGVGSDGRPRTWDEAETRASVALARTDPDAPKSLRFAEYYVDPCLDLLATRYRIERGQAEDIVQQFFCELEQPLERGELKGTAWKEALRRRYDRDRGSFRPFLGRALVNFARDWLRHDRLEAPGPGPGPDLAALAGLHEHEWRAALAAFAAAATPLREDAARAVAALQAVLGDGLAHAEAAVRLGVSERTVRNHLRLGGELLRQWLDGRAAARPAGHPVADGLHQALRLLPEWLHRPSAEKRQRTLLLLALAWRQGEATA